MQNKTHEIFIQLLIIILILFSCSKEEENINSKLKVDFTFSDMIDHFELKNTSKDIDGNILTCKWVSMCDTIKIINPYSSLAYINLPGLLDTAQLNIKLIVNDGYLSDSLIKKITLPPKTLERLYGLGRVLEDEHSNNVNYNWYYDQKNTGPNSWMNCGPTTATMVIKWVNQDFNKTPEDARNVYSSSISGWNTMDIINYLNLNSINNYTISIPQIDSIKSQISMGNIVILCLDMYYIRYQAKNIWHVDKFYSTNSQGWGHYIVIKGYKIVDREMYYEVYDPYSCGEKYSNGTLKGENRYYRSRDLNMAVNNWWNYAIVISKSKLKGSNLGVDVSKIIHKSG